VNRFVSRVCFGAPLAAAVGLAHAQGLPAGVTECLNRLEQAAERAGGSADAPRVGDVCPELGQRLAAEGWGASLAGGAAASLTRESLRRLAELDRHYRAAPSSAASLAPTELARVVRELEPFEAPPELSAWDRLLAKLREWLGLDDGRGGRLTEWLRRFSIPGVWIRAAVYGLVIVAVAVAFGAAVNEARRAGLRSRFRFPKWPSRGGARADYVRSENASLGQIRAAPVARQPILLFAFLVARLKSRYTDAIRDSATHRELVAAARGLGLGTADAFDAVAAGAESATYGGHSPGGAELETLVSGAEAVLGELDRGAEAAR
jgi:hypothetical protein